MISGLLTDLGFRIGDFGLKARGDPGFFRTLAFGPYYKDAPSRFDITVSSSAFITPIFALGGQVNSMRSSETITLDNIGFKADFSVFTYDNVYRTSKHPTLQ